MIRKTLSISILLLSLILSFHSPAFARRVKDSSLVIEISEEDRARYIAYLGQCNLQTSERNIQFFASLNAASTEAALSPRDTFSTLRALADTGILTEANLISIGNELIELGKASLEAGFHPENTFNTLLFLAGADVVTGDNLPQIIELGKASLAAGFDPKNTFDTLRSLARADVLTGDNLPQIIELGKASLAAGFHPWRTFNTLRSLVGKDVVTEDNLPQIIELGKAALAAGFGPENTFNTLLFLAGADVVTEDNLPQAIELGRASLAAGFNPRSTFDALRFIAGSDFVTEYNLPQIIELGKASLAAGFNLGDTYKALLFLAVEDVVTEDNLPQIIELGKASIAAGFEPGDTFNTLSSLARADVVTEDNLISIGNKLIELDRAVFQINADASSLFREIPTLITDQGFVLSDILVGGEHHEALMRFICRSGRYFKNNVAFLGLLRPENINQEVDTVLEYFVDLGTPLYLPSLYSEWKRLDASGREALISKLNIYYQNQLNGIKTEDPGLSDQVIEEADFYLIGSTNLTPTKYREILGRFSGQSIPDANFDSDFTWSLNLGSLTGELTEDEIRYLSGRIDWLREIVEKPALSYIADALGQFYSKFLVNKDIPEGAANLRSLIDRVADDPEVKSAIEARDANRVKARLEVLLAGSDLAFEDALLELFNIFTSTEAAGVPGVGVLREVAKLNLIRMYISDNLARSNIDSIIESGNRLNQGGLSASEVYRLIISFIELLSEIKPEAIGSLRGRLDEAVELPSLKDLTDRFKTEEGNRVEEIRILASKTELDYFYGYFGENCTSEYPEELLNPHFTPLRIITSRGIEGAIYTLSYEINGKKSLIIVGIEPLGSLASRTNPEELTEGLLQIIIDNIAIPNGYDQVLISTNSAAQSNRPQIQGVISKLIAGRPKITQNVQKSFPANSSYDITEVALYWQR